MHKKEHNYAFIDSQNLNLGIKDLGWSLDLRKFRKYLSNKYRAVKHKKGKIKGNIDAELVMYTMKEIINFDKAVIVSGDGDFYCLIKYLLEINWEA